MPGAAGVNEEEGMLLISLEPNEDETIEDDPIKREADQHAEQQRGHVNLVKTEAELKDKCASQVVAGSQMVGFLVDAQTSRVSVSNGYIDIVGGFLVDAQTSRVSVSNGYIDIVGRLISSLSLKKAGVAVVCGQRMELVSTVMARLNGIKGIQTFVIQLTGTPTTKWRDAVGNEEIWFCRAWSLRWVISGGANGASAPQEQSDSPGANPDALHVPLLPVLAGRELGADVFWLLDRPKAHSIKHGEDIMMRYWSTLRQRQLQKEAPRPAANSKKRVLRSADLQLIEGPILSTESQTVELLQVERKFPEYAASLATVASCMQSDYS
eukprot:s418_g31.t1